MNKTPQALTALTLAALCSALCSAPAVAAEGLHPVVGAALTFGGDTLAKVDYTDGSSQNIRSGGMLHLFGGVEYGAGNFTLQVNLGYHVDDTNADNGSVTLSRVPVEVLGFWKVGEQVRLGDVPEIGDVNRRDDLPAYRALARHLDQRGLLHVPQRVSYFKDDQGLADREAQTSWHRRFLE